MLARMNLIMLFYRNLSAQRTALVQKKMQIDHTSALILIESFKVFLSCLVIALLYKGLHSISPTVFILSLFVLYLINTSMVLFDSVERIKMKYNYDYLRLSNTSDDKFFREILVYNYGVRLLLSMPTTIPLAVFISIFAGIGGVSVLLLVNSVILFLYTLIKVIPGVTKQWVQSTLLVSSRILPFAIGYLFMSILVKLILLSRSEIHIYGFSMNYMLAMNHRIDQSENLVRKLNLLNVMSQMMGSWLCIACAIFVALLAMLLLLNVKSNSVPVQYKLYSWYVTIIQSLLKNMSSSEAYKYKDVCLLLNTGRELDKDPLGIFLPSELFLLAGANLALLLYIHNVYVYLFLFLVQIYMLVTGVLRTLCHLFPGVFRFESDCHNWIPLRLSERLNFSDVLASKYIILRRMALYPCATTTVLLMIEFSVYMRTAIFVLLPDFIIIGLLYSPIVKRILRTDYEVFCILASSGEVMNLSSVKEYSGYQAISTANSLFHRAIMYLTVLSSLVCAFFVLIRGFQWLWYDLAFSFAFAIVLLLSSRYYTKERKVIVKGS